MEHLESRRLLSAGELDSTFGASGVRDLDFRGSYDDIRNAAVLPDGGILIAGMNSVGDVEFMKITSSGELDAGFGGGDGKIGTTYEWVDEFINARIASHAPSGRVAVSVSTDGPLGRPADVLMLKLDGSIDTTFAGNGLLEGSDQFAPLCVAFQSDGRLIAAASRLSGQIGSRPDLQVVVRRYEVSGEQDMSFGDGGELVIQGTPQRATDLEILADGRIALATHHSREYHFDPYTHDVFYDVFFGNALHLLTADGGLAWERVVTSGSLDNGDSPAQGLDLEVAADQSLVLLYGKINAARLERFSAVDGAKDTTFNPVVGAAAQLEIDNFGRMLLMDLTTVRRFNADGALDLTYGALGTAAIDVDYAHTLMLHGGDQAVIAGYHDGGAGGRDHRIVRLQGGEGAAVPTVTLNRKGTLIVNTLDAAENVSLYIRSRDGRLVVRVGDFAKSFAPSKVKRIALFTHGGDDTITIGAGVKGSYVDAGDGADTINGGAGGDVLLGGTGPDQIFGNDGDDTLLGGGGNDYVLGGAGKDDLFGNGGIDTLSGAGGNDRLFGGPDAADIVRGGPGTDSAADDDKDRYESIETLLS